MRNNKKTLLLVTTSSLVAIAVLSARLVHLMGIPGLPSLISPMHFPIMLIGLLCGWQLAIVGAISAPLISFMISGGPMFPFIMVPMVLELVVYGVVCAVINNKLLSTKKLLISTVITLVIAIALGRTTNIITSALLHTVLNAIPFWATVIANLPEIFISTWLATIMQVTLIPALLEMLRRSNVLINYIDLPNASRATAQCTSATTAE